MDRRRTTGGIGQASSPRRPALPRNPVVFQPIDEKQLYYPFPPFIGTIKLRYRCTRCQNETVLCARHPVNWGDLVTDIRGECFTCDQEGIRIVPVFIDLGRSTDLLVCATEHEALEDFLGKYLIGRPQLVLPPGVDFARRCPAKGYNVLIFDRLYVWEDLNKSLDERYAKFLEIVPEQLKRIHEQEPERRQPSLRLRTGCDILGHSKKFFDSLMPHSYYTKFEVLYDDAIDMGGPEKAFYEEVSTKLLDPDTALYVASGPNNSCHPSVLSRTNEQHLEYFRFHGKLLARAFIMNRRVDASLTTVIFKLILGKTLTFNDLEAIDADLFKQLSDLLRLSEDQFEYLCLTFEVCVADFGKSSTFELKPGGAEIAVTKQNVREYVSAYASWRMFDSVKEQIESFLEGFYEYLPPQALGLFDERDIQLILGGVQELNVAQWKAGSRSYNFRTAVPQWFFEILEESDNEFRSKILLFVTATSRVRTFEALDPRFTLTALETDLSYLPIAATCFNQLKIPNYESKAVLKQKLLLVLEHSSGFGTE